ncbi:MAG TPA: hypothetical protein VKB80_24330 [Kofleriaceae bacterium]|nr:hypothetical protein [Kofleriaceae bacterium]
MAAKRSLVVLGARAGVTEHAAELVGLASMCQDFASLEEHAAQVARSKRIPRDEVPALRLMLGRAARAGLLVSEDALLAGLVRGAQTERCAISTVAVPTRDRVASLGRNLPTYVQDVLAQGRTVRWLVADDSADPAVGASCRDLLRDVRARHAIEVAYAGPREKRAFAAALAREGVDPDVLEFALFDPEGIGYTPGANQNAILLDTVGEPFLCVDDDTFCPLWRSPDARAGLEIGVAWPAAWPLSPANEADDGPPCEGDVLGKHESLLGRDLGACVRDVGADAARLHQLPPRELTRLETVPGRVIATWMGSHGDSVYTYPGVAAMAAHGDARRRMLATRRSFAELMQRCRLHHCVSASTIADGSFWTSTAAAYDHRRLLPPFMPVLRGQDFLFAATARAAFPEAWFGLLPHAVGHRRPSRPGPAIHANMVRPATFNFMSPLVLAVQGKDAPASDPAAALRHLGRGLELIASEPPAAFAERLTDARYQVCMEEIRRLDDLLARYRRTPRYWAREVDRCLGWWWQALRSGSCMTPAELAPIAGGESAPSARVQRLVLRFGRLLAAWPDVIEATRRVSARGLRPGVPLE